MVYEQDLIICLCSTRFISIVYRAGLKAVKSVLLTTVNGNGKSKEDSLETIICNDVFFF